MELAVFSDLPVVLCFGYALELLLIQWELI